MTYCFITLLSFQCKVRCIVCFQIFDASLNILSLTFLIYHLQEQILKSLDSYLYAIRASFPRLYFTSNNEMFQVLAMSRNPKAMVPFVRKCFPGITYLKFALPSSVASTIRTQLDATLNGIISLLMLNKDNVHDLFQYFTIGNFVFLSVRKNNEFSYWLIIELYVQK